MSTTTTTKYVAKILHEALTPEIAANVREALRDHSMGCDMELIDVPGYRRRLQLARMRDVAYELAALLGEKAEVDRLRCEAATQVEQERGW